MIEVSVIKKENDEAFWLGAEVGQTESASHIPTQTTSYKGINVPLTNWEYSFFKGYLLRIGQIKKYSFSLSIYVRATQVGSRWSYYQNSKSSCSRYGITNFILLNSQKQKINASGKVLDSDDTTSYNAYCYCNLAQGKYYCRIIRSDMVELGDDIEFNVVDNKKVDIILNPKLLKMEYSSNGISEEIAYDGFDTLPNKSLGGYVDGFTKDQPYNLSVSIDNSAKSVVFNYDISDVKLNDTSLSDIFSFEWQVGGAVLPLGGGSWESLLEANEYTYQTQDRGYVALENPLEVSNPNREYTYYLNRYGLDTENLVPIVKSVIHCNCNFDGTYYNASIRNCIVNSPKMIYNVEYSVLNSIWHNNDDVTGYQIGYYRQWWTKGGELYNYYFDDYQVSTVKNIHPKVTRTAFNSHKLNETSKKHTVLFDGQISDSNYEIPSEIVEIETNKEFMIRGNDFVNAFRWIYKKVGDMLSVQGYTKLDINDVNIYPYYQTSDGIIEAYSNDLVSRINNNYNPIINNDSSIINGFIAAPVIYNEIRKGYENYFE